MLRNQRTIKIACMSVVYDAVQASHSLTHFKRKEKEFTISEMDSLREGDGGIEICGSLSMVMSYLGKGT